jgi:hypothetical protein
MIQNKRIKWISISEKLPKKGQKVLVIGFLTTELSHTKTEKSVALVDWKSPEESECSDYCYYTTSYVNITHWHPISFPKSLSK